MRYKLVVAERERERLNGEEEEKVSDAIMYSAVVG